MVKVNPSAHVAKPAAHVAVDAHSRAVAKSLQDVLPTLFNGGEKALADALKSRPHEIVGHKGTDAHGSIKVAYTVKDEATAKKLAENLQGKWQWDDENMVGDNINMPKGDMITGFRAAAKGNQLVINLSWKPDGT